MTNATTLRFQRRPAPVLPEHRPLYKIAQIALTLHMASRAQRSSLPRLQLFNWAFKTAERAQRLSQAARMKSLNVPAWGFDPALAIALRYAHAEDLVSFSAGGYVLTDSGSDFAKAVAADPALLPQEKELLRSTGKDITEAMVESVAKEWEAK